MKKRNLFLLLFLLLIGVVGCDTHEEATPSSVDVASIAMDKINETLYVGEELQLKVSILPSNATNKTLSWLSSNEEVATVSSSGLVKAISQGTASISVKSNNDKTASMTVNVLADETLPEGVIFDSDFESAVMPRNFSINTGGGGKTIISDGLLKMSTVGQGTASASISFNEALYGTVLVETKIQVNQPAFTNALYFYTSGNSTNDIVATLAFENNYIKYHDGSGWNNITRYTLGEWYQLTMVLHIGKRLDGATKGHFDLKINDSTYMSLPFRNGGDGIEDNIWRLYLASEKSNSDFAYEYLRIFQIETPEIEVSSNEGVADLEDNPTYQLDYLVTGSPTPTVEITADKEAGYTIEDNLIRFTAAGTYKFKITATNQGGSVSEKIIIIVSGEVIAPQLEILEKNKTLILTQETDYNLDYKIIAGLPEPSVEILCDKDTGYSLEGNQVTFTEAGIYEFTIKASNNGGVTSDNIRVLVLENETFLDLDFDQIPEDAEIDTGGSGDVKIVDGNLNITAAGSSNYAFVTFPFYHKLENKVVIETRVKVNTDAFSNLIYLNANNNNKDRAVTIGMFESHLRVHNEKTWVDIAPIINGEYYQITLVLDIDAASYELYLDGVLLGTYPFRNEEFKDDITHFNLGAEKEGADIYFDYLKVSYLTKPEIILNEETKTIEMETSASYELDYLVKTSYPSATINISCDAIEGYSIDENLVSFTKPGVYEFIITASNLGGSDSKTITVTIIGLDLEPEVIVLEDYLVYDINSLNPLLLEYQVSGYPTPLITITADQETGYIIDGNQVVFSEIGTYIFTIEASNESGADTATITVLVESPESAPSIIMDDLFHHDLTEGAFLVPFELGGNPEPTYTITSDTTALIEDNSITFLTPGIYLFTLNAINSVSSVEKEFAVEVVEYYAPEIVIYEDFKEINLLVNPAYTLNYEVTAVPDALTLIDVNHESGFSLNGKEVGFTVPGTYIFTITSSNLKGEDTKEITVNVIMPEGGNYHYANDFNELPEDNLNLSGGAIAETVDGGLKLSTIGRGTAKFGVKLDDYLSGTIAVRTKVKLNSNASINIFFLYSGSTNVLGVLIDNYQLRYHDGSNWTNIGFTCPVDEWFEVMAVITLGSGLFDLYVNGNKYEGLSLRNTGEVEYAVNEVGNVGIDNRSDVEMHLDYYQIYNLNPVINTESTSLGTSLDNPQVSLDYQILSALDTEVEITSEQEAGYILSGNEITFTEAGTYIFTINAVNAFGSTSKEVMIIVSESYIDPELTLLETSGEVDLAGINPIYILSYETNIAVPAASLSITCDATEGFIINGDEIRFNLEGTYKFTLEYANERNSSIKEVVVVVLKTDVNNFIEEDFNSSNDLPTDFEEIKSGTGNIEIVSVDGGDGNVLQMSTGDSGAVDFNKYFDENLSGTVVVKTRVMVGSGAFSNVLFFKSAAGSTVACLAFENEYIRYHSGSGWINTNIPYEYNSWYELKVILYIDAAKFDLYVNNEYYGIYNFRTPSEKGDINHLNMASNKKNAIMYYDYLELYYIPEVMVLEEDSEVSINITSGTYELKYNVLGLVDPVVITCDQESGFSIEGDIVTFTEEGRYVFTITASNNGGLASSKTITVNVVN